MKGEMMQQGGDTTPPNGDMNKQDGQQMTSPNGKGQKMDMPKSQQENKESTTNT